MSSSEDTTYPYYKYIKSPKQLGISSDGNLTTLGNDVTGLIAYVELLVSGQGKASATGKPLGNKFFLSTNSTCNDVVSNQPVDRYIYLSNIPNGNIPFLSSAVGGNFTEFEGLIPGILSNLSNLTIPDPSEIFSTFQNGGTNCQSVTLEVINTNNQKSQESHYVAVTDISKIDACLFPNKKNPVTQDRCSELFQSHNKEEYIIPNDIFVKLYFWILGLFIIFFALKILFSTHKMQQ